MVTASTIVTNNIIVYAQWEKRIPVSSIEILGSLVNVGRTVTMGLKIKPSNATGVTLFWRISDPTIATVDAETGAVTGISEGQTTLTVTEKTSGISTSVSLFVRLDTPQFTNCVTNKTSVSLAWNSVPGAQGYKIYYNTRDAESDATCINVGTSLNKTFNNLKENTKYWFWVAAYGQYESSGWDEYITTTGSK